MFKNTIEHIAEFYNINRHEELFDVLQKIIRFDSGYIFFITPEDIRIEYSYNSKIPSQNILIEKSLSKKLFKGVFDKDFSDLVNAEGCKSTIRVHTMLQSEKIKSKIWKEKYAVFSKAYDADVYFWETPEWGTKYDLHLFPNSFGDPEPFYCIAEEIRKVFSRRGLPVLAQEDYRRPVNFLWVSYAAAGNAAMAANLETGLTGNSQFAVHAQLKGAVQNVAEGFIAPTILRQDPDGVFIALAGHKAGIVTFEKQETKREGRQTGYGRPNGKKSSKAFRASANDQSRIDENV